MMIVLIVKTLLCRTDTRTDRTNIRLYSCTVRASTVNGTIFHEKLVVFPIVMKYLALYETSKFITVLA